MLRSLRTRRGWTLADVSRRTGLPISTLSKVENDKMSLTFDKLARLSEGLEVDIARLFGEVEEPAEKPSSVLGRRSITRAGEGVVIETPAYGYVYPASDLLKKRVVPIVVEIKARSLEAFGDLISHPGEEYVYVLEGEVELHTEHYAPVRLKAGDSIYFDSGMGHAYIAVGRAVAKVLSVCSASETQLMAVSRGQGQLADEPANTDEPPRARRG